MYSHHQRAALLNLARRAIAHFLEHGTELQMDETAFEKDLKEKRGVFVTLTLNGNLKGCIGHIVPVQPLYKDVIQNALAAAFDDPRFEPLSRNDFANVHIEISVLSLPKPLKYDNPEDLASKLRPGKDGVIIKKGFNRATYLPQVWDDLPDKEMFLGSLCNKAGLDSDEWRQGKLEVETYTVEMFEEE